MRTAAKVPSAGDRTVATTRLIDAPRELVFRPYAEPAHEQNFDHIEAVIAKMSSTPTQS